MRISTLATCLALALACHAAPAHQRPKTAARLPATAVTAVAFSPSGSTIATGRYGQVTIETSFGNHGQVSSFAVDGAVNSLAFSKNGDVLAAAGGSPGKEGLIQ